MIKQLNRYLSIITLVMLLPLCGYSHATDTIIFKGNFLFPKDIGKHVYFLTDSLSTSDINQISKLPASSYTESKDDIINAGLSKSTIWVKLCLSNVSSEKNLLLEIDNPVIDNITFYTLLSDSNWSENTISNDQVFDNRKIKNQKFIFEIPNHDGSCTEIYLKIKSNTPLVLPLKIGTPNQIYDRNNNEDVVNGLYFGFMLVMFLYNLFIYFTVKDKSYLYYIFYILFVALVQANLKGWTFKYIWPNHPEIEHYSLIILSAFTAFGSIAFIRNFLHTKKFSPKLDKGFMVFTISYLATIGICIWGNKITSYNLLNVNALPLALYLLSVAIYIWRKHRYRPAGFFLLAWSFFLVSIILFVLKEVGVFPYNILTTSFILIGSSLEALFLSFALADKINSYRKEKEDAQKEALNIAQENERIIREQNVTLEIMVDDRTKELNISNNELSLTLTNLKETQSQLVESEKMASLGQLTAGIAHEINNPINFVTSNVKPLKRDVDLLLDLIDRIEHTSVENSADTKKLINNLKQEFDFDYLKEEISFLLKGINEGSSRTAEIVKGLRIFSRVDEDDLKKADINEGLDSTLIIVNNQLNGRINIKKEYGNIPLTECYPGKLNQVFLNMISNAIYAIHNKFGENSGGEITISTSSNEQNVLISFKDNGMGMNEATQNKLFEPFFTTKPVGEGTGLGLSISYNTIKKHNGTIRVNSEENKGTEFIIEIPINQLHH